MTTDDSRAANNSAPAGTRAPTNAGEHLSLRREAEHEMRRAIAAVAEKQRDIPVLVDRAMAAVLPLAEAVREHYRGAAMMRAENAARRIARLDFEAEIEQREEEARGSPWGYSVHGVGKMFGAGYVAGLLRDGGLVQAFDGVEQTAETRAIGEAVLILVGQLRPRLAGL